MTGQSKENTGLFYFSAIALKLGFLCMAAAPLMHSFMVTEMCNRKSWERGLEPILKD